MEFKDLDEEYLFCRVVSLSRMWQDIFNESLIYREEHISIAALNAKRRVRQFADMYIIPMIGETR